MPNAFIVAEQYTLRRDCRERISINNVYHGNGKNRRSQPFEICRICGNGWHWINKSRLIKDKTRQPVTIGKLLGGPLTDPHIKRGLVIPSHCDKQFSLVKLKDPVPSEKSHTVLDDRIDIQYESKNSSRKQEMYILADFNK